MARMAGSQILAGPTLVQAGRSGGGFPKCMKPGPDGALSLRDQARAIACSASDPANAWKKLCEWASAQPDSKAAMHPALFQRAMDDLFQFPWQGGIEGLRPGRLVRQDGLLHLFRGLAWKGLPPRRRLIEHRAEAEDVCPRIQHFSPHLLR